MTINSCLVKHQSLSQIARTIGCSPSTIYREITSNCKIRLGKDIMYCTLSKLFYDYSYADKVANNRKTQSRISLHLLCRLTYCYSLIKRKAYRIATAFYNL